MEDTPVCLEDFRYETILEDEEVDRRPISFYQDSAIRARNKNGPWMIFNSLTQPQSIAMYF